MIERIKRIKEKLKQSQKGVSCFGSKSHKFLSQLVPEKDLLKFEADYDISLPEEYRTFIKEVGVGAGPHYGLHDLSNWLCDDETEVGEKDFLSSPCLLEPSEGRGFTGWEEDLEEKHGIPWERRYQGILSISSQGCTYLSGLVITGPMRGQIIFLDLDDQHPNFTKLGFLDWYEKWLDAAMLVKK